MTQQDAEQTRAFPSLLSGSERTIVAQQQTNDATQMGATLTCPVCGTANTALEMYCGECGFLLASTPGSLEGPSGEDAQAIALVEEKTGRRFLLHEGVNPVGRENCDVLLMDATVSRRHAEIAVSGSAVTVTDLASTNGTQLDGVPLPAHQGTEAREGAVIRFGSASLRLVGASEPADASAEATSVPTGDGEPVPASEAVAPAARLVALDDGSLDIVIGLGVTSIGRRAGNTHVITDDPYVSGRHAEVAAASDGITITDLGSTNGTTVNGERIAAHQSLLLLESDEVTIGQSRYRLEIEVGLDAASGPEEEVTADDEEDATLGGIAVLDDDDGTPGEDDAT